jgi:hypothetical protein
MEIVQTGTGTWPWCMGMFGARFAVFVRRARVLLTPCPAIRNLSFLRFHWRRHPAVSTCCFTGKMQSQKGLHVFQVICLVWGGSLRCKLPLYTKGKVNRIDLIVVPTPKFPKFCAQLSAPSNAAAK